MKKTLIALAALASATAFAQSNVTLYGKVNMGIGDFGAAGEDANLKNGPDGSSSRWGLRGSEDIGGGLKFNFQYESGLSPDTGAADGTYWQRSSWGGLSGGFGEIRYGRQYTIGFFASIGDMPATSVDPQLAVGLGFAGMGSRNNDQIQYWSPRFGGLQVRASVQLSGDAADPVTEVAANYSAGPLTANLSTGMADNIDNALAINAAYNFGVAKLAVGYVKGGNAKAAADRKGLFARVTAPMGSLSPFVGIANNSESDTTAWDVGAFYSLSKRTRVYGILGGGNKAVTDKYAIGIDHNF